VPLFAGWNVTDTVVVALGPSVLVPGAAMAKLAGFAPPNDRLSSDTLAVELRFAMVTLTDTAPPTTTEPKSMLVGETAMPGVGALTRFCGSLGARNWKSLLLLFVS
jgi:hypothetical protein